MVFGKSSFVANAKDQGSHAIGDGRVVGRLCFKEVKVRLITALIEELRIVGFQLQTYRIAEPRLAEIQPDCCGAGDKVRLLGETRRVGLGE